MFMNYADALEELYRSGMDTFWRNAKAMPEEKLEWQPTPDNRTARALIEEVVMTTGFSAKLISTMQVPTDEPSKDGEKSLADLEAEHRAAAEEYLKAVKEFPEDKLHDTIDLPWGKMTFLEVINYPYWNIMYHYGQLGYIQMMYGDKEMH
jgi:hypothetical protein